MAARLAMDLRPLRAATAPNRLQAATALLRRRVDMALLRQRADMVLRQFTRQADMGLLRPPKKVDRADNLHAYAVDVLC